MIPGSLRSIAELKGWKVLFRQNYPALMVAGVANYQYVIAPVAM